MVLKIVLLYAGQLMAVEAETQPKIDAAPGFLSTLFDDGGGNTRRKVLGIYGVLLVFNAAAWLSALLAFRHFPVLLGTAFLAYSFGLRHAVDADHIAAIADHPPLHADLDDIRLDLPAAALRQF